MHRKLFNPEGGHGFTALELLLSIAVGLTMIGVAVPVTASALDGMRAGMAARYLQARIMDARMQALRRSTRVGLRFEAINGDYRFAEYLDGNGNGIRTADIAAGLDTELVPRQYLRDHFAGVSFGLLANIPDLDGAQANVDVDGIRIGASRILTLGPDGTSSSGTLYVHGRRAQYAVRVLGATGRTRLLRFEPGVRQWIAR